MKILVAGCGYVGLSNAVLLAQHKEVIIFDVDIERLNKLKSSASSIYDQEIANYLETKSQNLKVSS